MLEIFEIRIYHGYILQIFLAEMLFFPVLERRGRFWLRITLSFIVFALLSVILTNIIYRFLQVGLHSFTIFLLSLALGLVCFKRPFKNVLFCFVGAQLLQNLAHNLENIFYLPFSEEMSNMWWFVLSVAVMVAVYVAAYFIVIRRFSGGRKISLQGYGVLIIALFSMLFCYLVQFLLQVYAIDQIWVTALPLVLCDVLALFLQFGLQGYKWKVDENAELERFIAREGRHYADMQANIDIINMKAHDLKHFIKDIRAGKNVDDGGLDEIQEAVEKYEQTANTGNKAIDAVLTEKMYACHKSGIALSAFVQGEELGFMHLSDITSIFGNILGNAIECEQGIDDTDKRFIFLNVYRTGDMVCIHIENYFEGQPEFKDDLPVTTKGSTDFHGYGLKSVRYAVKKYGGNLTVRATGTVFVVDIIIPCPGAVGVE